MTVTASVDRIFEYIRDYPDTSTEMKSLREYLRECREYKQLAVILQKQLRARLLIPGAHTKDILKMYVRTHKTLQFLLAGETRHHWNLISDTSDLVVEYLLRRKDAVKCVVAAMLGDDDVLEEAETLNEVTGESEVVDDDATSDLAWIPPPFRNRRTAVNDVSANGDVKSMVQLLVDVFGGRERFLTEYKRMLSTRLLQIGSSYECEREIGSLEMMKLKFGEDDLIDCQIMVKDISSSRRINQSIHEIISDKHQVNNLSALIISRHYWPLTSQAATSTGSLLPASLEKLLDEYAKAYHKLRPSQRLEWRRDAGVVDMTVELDDGTVAAFRVSPVQVAVLTLFEDARVAIGLSVEQVARQLGISNELARKELTFWTNHGMLSEVDVNRFNLTSK